MIHQLTPSQSIFDLRTVIQKNKDEDGCFIAVSDGWNSKGDITFTIRRDEVILSYQEANYSLSRATFDKELEKSCKKGSDTVRSFALSTKIGIDFNTIK